MSNLTSTTLVLAAVLAALSLAACGGDDDDDTGGDDTGAATAGATEVEVEMGEEGGVNYFDPDEITVPAGTTIKFTTVNVGAAIHNMRIAGPDNMYNTEDDAANDDFVNPGETASFDWDVPEETGAYKFQCDLHPTDMVGTITIE